MKRSYQPDWRPEKRKKDKTVMTSLHAKGVTCVLTGAPGSLHHLLKRSQGGDDVEANLVGLAGSGTTGIHGLIEAGDERTRRDLGQYVLMERPDFLDYIDRKLGSEASAEWLRTHLFI